MLEIHLLLRKTYEENSAKTVQEHFRRDSWIIMMQVVLYCLENVFKVFVSIKRDKLRQIANYVARNVQYT